MAKLLTLKIISESIQNTTMSFRSNLQALDSIHFQATAIKPHSNKVYIWLNRKGMREILYLRMNNVIFDNFINHSTSKIWHVFLGKSNASISAEIFSVFECKHAAI